MNIAEIEGLLVVAEESLKKAAHGANEIKDEGLLERVATLAKELDATRPLLAQKRRTLCQALLELAYVAGIRAVAIPRHHDMLELFSETWWRITNNFHGGKRDFPIEELLEYSTEDFKDFCETTLRMISAKLPLVLESGLEDAAMIRGVVSKVSELLASLTEKQLV